MGIDTRSSYSTLYWDSHKYKRKITHSLPNLPELPVNEGVSTFARFLSKFTLQVNDSIQHLCCCTLMHLNQWLDAENSQNSDFLCSMMYLNDNMIYKIEGTNALVKVMQSQVNDNGIFEFIIKHIDGWKETTTREFLTRPEQPEIPYIPTTINEYCNFESTLTDEQTYLRILTPHKQEFIDMHHQLFHLPFTIMFRLAKLGVLPKYFMRPQKHPPPYTSCLFEMTHRKPWRSKSQRLPQINITKSGHYFTKSMHCGWSNSVGATQSGSSKNLGSDCFCWGWLNLLWISL